MAENNGIDNGKEKLILYGLDPAEYEHELDRRALEALQGTPGLERFMRWMNENYYELTYIIRYTGSCVEVTPRMFPKLHRTLVDVCNTIHLRPVPPMYIEQNPEVNAFTSGSENPIIIVNSGLIELLTEDEVKCVIGHECGHIKSGHCLYSMMAWELFPYFCEVIATFTAGYSDLATKALAKALQYWSRMSEYTADRAGLLAVQDIKVAISTEMKIGGGVKGHFQEMDTDAFLDQARRFKDFDENGWKAALKMWIISDNSHPWSVDRAKELDKWIQSEQYAKLLKKRGVHMTFKICPNTLCGNPVTENTKFCNKCGTKILE